MLLINNVIIHGEFNTHKLRENSKTEIVNFFGNNLKIISDKKKFTANIRKNINFIFHENSLHQLLSNVISCALDFSSEITHLQISNIHQSTTFPFNTETVKNEIFPTLLLLHGISQIEASEESNVSTPIPLETLENNIKNFICFSIKLTNPPATVKFQASRCRKFTHCTLILNNFSTPSRTLCEYFDNVSNPLQKFS